MQYQNVESNTSGTVSVGQYSECINVLQNANSVAQGQQNQVIQSGDGNADGDGDDNQIVVTDQDQYGAPNAINQDTVQYCNEVVPAPIHFLLGFF